VGIENPHDTPYLTILKLSSHRRLLLDSGPPNEIRIAQPRRFDQGVRPTSQPSVTRNGPRSAKGRDPGGARSEKSGCPANRGDEPGSSPKSRTRHPRRFQTPLQGGERPCAQAARPSRPRDRA
jgi:hypothetical protein